jgi:hypothetical protein
MKPVRQGNSNLKTAAEARAGALAPRRAADGATATSR